MFGCGWVSGAWQTLVAVVVIGITFMFPMPSTIVSERLSNISFGIYLIHPAVYAVLTYILPQGILPNLDLCGGRCGLRWPDTGASSRNTVPGMKPALSESDHELPTKSGSNIGYGDGVY